MGVASTVTYILINRGYLVDIPTNGDGLVVTLPHRLVSVEEVEAILGDLVFPGEVFKHNYTIAIMFY